MNKTVHHSKSPNIPVEQTEFIQNPNAEQAGNKFRTSYGVVIDTYGGNPYKVADILYDSLYDPEKAMELHGIAPSEKFPDRQETLTAELPHKPSVVPSREEFIEIIRATMTRNQERHQASLYPDALETLRVMAESHPTIVWTQGDAIGYPEHNLPGSSEQLRKIVGAGIGKLRKSIARSAIASDSSTSFERKRPQDILSVIATEDKLSEQSAETAADYFKKFNVETVYIVEDRLKNVRGMQELLEKRGIAAKGIVILSGKEKAEKLELPENTDITSAASVSDAKDILKDVIKTDEKIGFLCDFDGVLSDQKSRVKGHVSDITQVLEQRSWI